MRYPLLFLLAVTIGLLNDHHTAAAAESENQSPQRHALLVGCTKYPNLALGLQLVGPSNDVALTSKLLTDRFKFAEKDIVTLVQSAPEERLRPTRANIQREFKQLAERVQAGDQVLVLLAGHGSQQPDNDPENLEDPEPDGLDEIFLPADIGDWEDRKGKVENAIVDDEIRQWLAAILNKGAYVWAIVDACHSGTMVRGVEEEVSRQVLPATLGLTDSDLQRARERAAAPLERTRGAVLPDIIDAPLGDDHLAALYAAQSGEPTVELPMPREGENRTRYGLLTYTVNLVLSQTTVPITYRELAQRVQQQYDNWGRLYPTPLVEGTNLDGVVLEARKLPGRSHIVLSHRNPDTFTINAGLLHGMTVDSVLAVFPPPGLAGQDRPLGHVKVVETRAVESVVEPTKYERFPAVSELPAGGRCETRYYDFGAQRLRVAVKMDGLDQAKEAYLKRDQVVEILKQLAGEKGTPIVFVAKPNQADFIVVEEKGQAYLCPASGYVVPADSEAEGATKVLPPLFGPLPTDASLANTLHDLLQKIARARALLRLASEGAGSGEYFPSSIDVEMEFVRRRPRSDGAEPQFEAIPWENGWVLRDGETIWFRVTNRGKGAVDVTVLFVGEKYDIQNFFPHRKVRAVNPIAAGNRVMLKLHVQTASSKEHLVVIAVPSDAAGGATIDFSCLSQTGLERTRSTSRGRAAMETPLGKLLENAFYAEGGTRGLSLRSLDDYKVKTISWRVESNSSSGR